MKIMIGIPTWKKNVDLLLKEIENSIKNSIHDIILYATCKNQSASKNRNLTILEAKKNNCDIIIQCDDDVKIFEHDWLDKLVEPLIKYKEDIAIIAPQLVDDNGNHTAQLGDNSGIWGKSFINNDNLKIALHTDKTGLNLICSACIAFFVSDNIIFDENYLFACFEDTDFSLSYIKQYSNKKNMINLSSKIIHKNHGSWRKGNKWNHNRNYFNKKWNLNL